MKSILYRANRKVCIFFVKKHKKAKHPLGSPSDGSKNVNFRDHENSQMCEKWHPQKLHGLMARGF